MKGTRRRCLTLIGLSCVLVMGNSLAASLEKYSSSPAPIQQIAPQLIPQPRFHSQQQRIRLAVHNINTATPENRQKLVAEYQRRLRLAVESGDYRAANFYQEILRQSGNQP